MNADRRPRKNVLSTAIAPAPGAAWRGKARPCQHCRARIITAKATTMDVQHEPRCPALGNRE